MSIALLGDVLAQARTHLNDDDASNWPDQRLRLKAKQAFNELQAELLVAGIPIINAVTTVLTVPALLTDDANLDISTVSGYPTDIIMPIWMKERATGQMNADFVDMTEVDFLPNIQKSNQLIWWSWIKQTVMVLGALVDTQVQLRYQRLLNVPSVNTDTIAVLLGELFLSYRIAALAIYPMDKAWSKDLNATATVNLDKIVRMNIKQLQDLPAKRRPYHRGRGRSRVIRDF